MKFFEADSSSCFGNRLWDVGPHHLICSLPTSPDVSGQVLRSTHPLAVPCSCQGPGGLSQEARSVAAEGNKLSGEESWINMPVTTAPGTTLDM